MLPRTFSLSSLKLHFSKKGTCHITFTDTKLLDKLNVYGSQKKGWLPPGFGCRFL